MEYKFTINCHSKNMIYILTEFIKMEYQNGLDLQVQKLID